MKLYICHKMQDHDLNYSPIISGPNSQLCAVRNDNENDNFVPENCKLSALHKPVDLCCTDPVWLNGLVVSALGMRTRRPRFESLVAPLFHWVATLGKLFTHTSPPPVSQLQETGVQKGVWRLSGYGD